MIAMAIHRGTRVRTRVHMYVYCRRISSLYHGEIYEIKLQPIILKKQLVKVVHT